jgi:hypothetical protein
VGACVELGGVVELGVPIAFGNAAIWAKLGPQLSKAIAAAIKNKGRICTSRATSR